MQVSLGDLITTRLALIDLMRHSLNAKERLFLLSVKQMEPKWELLGLEHEKSLPAVQWKLLNLRKMPKSKHRKAVEKLRSFLDL